jgi:hypothetical protein
MFTRMKEFCMFKNISKSLNCEAFILLSYARESVIIPNLHVTELNSSEICVRDASA